MNEKKSGFCVVGTDAQGCYESKVITSKKIFFFFPKQVLPENLVSKKRNTSLKYSISLHFLFLSEYRSIKNNFHLFHMNTRSIIQNSVQSHSPSFETPENFIYQFIVLGIKSVPRLLFNVIFLQPCICQFQLRENLVLFFRMEVHVSLENMAIDKFIKLCQSFPQSSQLFDSDFLVS